MYATIIAMRTICYVLRLYSFWPPYGIRQAIIFLPCGFFLLLSSIFFLSSPNLNGHRLDVYHSCTHGVALVRM